MDKPQRPPKQLIPTISIKSWTPDQRAMDVAMGKKSDEKSDRRANH